jgi:large subunit ribosomal protein L22
MNARATAKFVGTSPRKISLVAAMIRGQRAGEALHLLAYANKRAATPVGKVLASAMANATNNHGARERDLVVEEVLVGAGPTLKRIRPRAKGSAAAILHRSSHITVVVSDGKSGAVSKAQAEVKAEPTEVKSTSKRQTPSTKHEERTAKSKKPSTEETK